MLLTSLSVLLLYTTPYTAAEGYYPGYNLSQSLDWIDSLPIEPELGTFALNDHMVVHQGLEIGTIGSRTIAMLIDTTQACTWLHRVAVPEFEASTGKASDVRSVGCAYHAGSTYATGYRGHGAMTLAGFRLADQDVLLVDDFESSRAGGIDAFLQQGQALAVLGLNDISTLFDAASLQRHDPLNASSYESPVGGVKSLPFGNVGGPVSYYEIAMASMGGAGKLVLGGTFRRDPGSWEEYIRRYDVNANGPKEIWMSDVCFDKADCHREFLDYRADSLVLDSLSLVVRLRPEQVAKLASKFDPPAKKDGYLVDTRTGEK